MSGVVSEKEWQDGMDYAHALAAKFASRWNIWGERDDLLSEAYLALHHALGKFDPERGVKFTTYARYWIDQHMRRWRDLRHHIGEHEPLSLDMPCGQDEDSDLLEIGAFGESTEFPEEWLLNKVLLAEALPRLTARERDLLHRLYWEQQNLREVAEAWGCSRQRVEQLQKRALRRLHFMLARRLKGDAPCSNR